MANKYSNRNTYRNNLPQTSATNPKKSKSGPVFKFINGEKYVGIKFSKKYFSYFLDKLVDFFLSILFELIRRF